MNDGALMSPDEAASEVAEVFKDSGRCSIAVREDRAFPSEWFPLGNVALASGDPSEDPTTEDLTSLVSSSAFEWRLPEVTESRDKLSDCLGLEEKNDNVDRALADIASIGVRIGLLHPIFDPASLEEMPFRRSTTVVSDTSGVLQGALDFVVRHLPEVRVKVPAIVQMEIVNSADRFFRFRRASDKGKKRRRVRELIEHLKSQGGQRTLVRLETQADTEIERTWLFGDPLRSAFQPERDNELSNLNISVPIAAYVDRLILEAARHHQAQSGPGHRVRLLTGDQGLARMALAEGIAPLYFRPVEAADFFGRRLTGQTFDPFTGLIRRTPLPAVLWELATAFGSARLANESGRTFTLFALGKGPSWSPYHSVDDLLWCRSATAAGGSGDSSSHPSGPPGAGLSGRFEPSSAAVLAAPLGDERSQSPHISPPSVARGSASAAEGRGDTRASRSSRPRPSRDAGSEVPGAVGQRAPNVVFQRFNVGRLLRFICALDDGQEMNQLQVTELLEARHPRGRDEYRRFLSSANLVSVTNGNWRAEPSLGPVSAALRNERIGELRDAFREAPSFSAFADRIERSPVGRVVELSDLGRSKATYRTLGEITLLCAPVHGEGVYPTPAAPAAATFGQVALERFSELDHGDGLVSTGAWLESLIRENGIHPERARRLLDEASAQGILRRSTEGSTTQLRFDDHMVHVLRTESGMPVVRPVHLYRGDYLIPGKGSVSLRIEGPIP